MRLPVLMDDRGFNFKCIALVTEVKKGSGNLKYRHNGLTGYF